MELIKLAVAIVVLPPIIVTGTILGVRLLVDYCQWLFNLFFGGTK